MPFPDFNFNDIKGINYTNSKTQGNYLIIKCWFINCKSCINEFDELNKFTVDHQNVNFISLALDEKEEASFQNKDQLGSLRFEKEYLMFQPDNKKGGIFKMMEILQAPIQDVVVFGDDYNDLDMFDKDLWTGVAMGNACDALKEKATYITDKNVDDGIYNICEKMGWF